MVADNLSRRDFYVYALFREDGITPFYIGKGCGRRLRDHEGDARRERGSGNPYKDHIIRNMLSRGIKFRAEKLVECLAEDIAFQIEADLILLLGRNPRGPLVNRTDGGIGGRGLSQESRDKISARMKGRFVSEETKARMSAGSRNKEPEVKARQSAAKKGKPNPLTEAGRRALAESSRQRLLNLPPDLKYRMTHGFAGKRHTEETRQKLSLSKKGKKKGPLSAERKRQISVQMRERNSDPEVRRRAAEVRAQANRLRVWTPEQRQAISDARKNLSPEARERVAAAQRGKKLSPETRRKISESQKGRTRAPHTQETKDKLSKAHKGKTISQDTRKKLGEASKKHAHRVIPLLAATNRGAKRSEETKKKMSEARALWWAKKKSECLV